MEADHDFKLEPFLIDMDNLESEYLSSLECGCKSLNPFNFLLIVDILRSKMPLHSDLLQKMCKVLERIIMRK